MLKTIFEKPAHCNTWAKSLNIADHFDLRMENTHHIYIIL